MSILKRKRSKSPYKFYINAIKLRVDITRLLLKDLGTKKIIRDIKLDETNIKEIDIAPLQELVDKYSLITLPSEYPKWIIEYFRKSLWELLREMHINITNAYSLFPTNKEELLYRRLSQDKVIANCESLLQEFQLIMEILPIDPNKYLPYVDMIEEEIRLIKGWRKSDNRKYRYLLNGESNDIPNN